MSCKDILPQVKIDGIAIKQTKYHSDMNEASPERSFSSVADETYFIGISHTNLIQIDSFLDAFSFGDLLNATVDTPSLYNVKFLFTDDPQTYQVIEDAIKLIDEVSFFLHGDGQTATSEDIITLKKKVDNAKPGDKPPAPPAVTAAIETLNKCTFKLVKGQTAKKEPLSIATAGNCNELLAAFSKLSLAEINNQNLWTGVSWSDFLGGKWEKFGCEKEPFNKAYNIAVASAQQAPTPSPEKPSNPTPKVKTLIDNIIDALTDNQANPFTPTQDKIFSFSKPLEVDQKKITIQGESLLPTVTNSQVTGETFYDTQLKNFYIVVIPNVEYRENNKLIFTVRQYVSIPLVIDYEPQQYGATVDKTVSLEFLEQNPELNLEKLAAGASAVKARYGENGYKTFIQNANPKALFTTPEISLGYNRTVNGTFFLNMKNLGERLTVFTATLENPELYKGVVQKVSMKKVYDDGTEVELPVFNLIGLALKDTMMRGYRFTDEYDIKNFKYVISVDAKNPLEKLVQYVMPQLVAGKKVVDAMLDQLLVAKQMQSTVVLNPVSGYFTDDFLASSYYLVYNSLFVQTYQLLYNLYNFLLPKQTIISADAQGNAVETQVDPFLKNDKNLVNTQQVMELQTAYDQNIKTMQVLATTEGISIQGQSSQSNKKKGNKNPQPYKTISQTFDKGYMSSDGPVFFDFLYAGPPSTNGFMINKPDLLNRVDFEAQLLNAFGVSESDNTYAGDEPISITPLSIMVDNISVNLTDYEDLEDLENTTTNILLAAEVEVQKPSSTFKGQSNTFVELLELENTTVVTTKQKTLKVKTVGKNFYPLALIQAMPIVQAEKFKKKKAAAAALFKDLMIKAQAELGKETAKSLFLNEADYSTAVLATAALEKLGWYDGNKIDPKHSFLNRDIPGFPQKIKGLDDLTEIDKEATKKAKEVLAPFYKQAPATFMTRFMNSYQLEYISDVDVETSKPVYSPLTKNVIAGIADATFLLARLRLKAGYPIAKEYTEMYTTFIVGAVGSLPDPNP